MIATERTKQTMADIRAQLDSLHHGESADSTLGGGSVMVPDVSVLCSIIEQLVTRIEQLEAKAS
jgi:hypothetical protein